MLKLSSKTDLAEGGFTAVDKIFVLWAFLRAIATYLEFVEVGAIVNQCGFLIDTVGGFFLMRFLVRDEEDFARVKTFACNLAILSLTMLNEQFRAQNVFGFIGGRLNPFVRDGAIRSQGSFEGPIPAGTFAGTLLCLFLWLWQSKKSRFLAMVGVLGCTIMVVTNNFRVGRQCVPWHGQDLQNSWIEIRAAYPAAVYDSSNLRSV